MLISRREFIQAVGWGVATMSLGRRPALGGEGDPRSDRPNVVIIFTDDQGYQDVGCFGSPTIKTPHLDRMAAEGVRFTDFYAVASVCSPSRAGLLTGCYPPRLGITQVLFPDSRIGLNPEEITIAKMLGDRGYATACIGKWHLGEPPDFHPFKYGFDHFFGLPFSNTTDSPRYPDEPRLMRSEEVIETRTERATLTRRCTEEALAFISRNRARPFFLYLAHPMPHIQLDATPAFKGKSAGGLYGDVIEEIDWSVGEVLAALNRAGLDDKTLVIFTSDNGPWLAMKDQGGSALPLRDGKFSVFEGGMRVPCLMRWQGKIPPGRVSSELCATIDLLPTVARLAGGKLPAARVRDGKDIWPLLSGRAGARSPHKAFFYHQAGNLLAVRGGKWKLHLAREEGERGVFGGNRPAAPAYLYDLEADVGERHDLAADHRDLVEQFTHLARRFQQELAATSRPPGKLSGK